MSATINGGGGDVKPRVKILSKWPFSNGNSEGGDYRCPKTCWLYFCIRIIESKHFEPNWKSIKLWHTKKLSMINEFKKCSICSTLFKVIRTVKLKIKIGISFHQCLAISKNSIHWCSQCTVYIFNKTIMVWMYTMKASFYVKIQALRWVWT